MHNQLSMHTSRNMIGDYFQTQYQSQPVTFTEAVENTIPQKQEERKSFSKKLKIVTGIVAATIAVGVSIAAIKYLN